MMHNNLFSKSSLHNISYVDTLDENSYWYYSLKISTIKLGGRYRKISYGVINHKAFALIYYSKKSKSLGDYNK